MNFSFWETDSWFSDIDFIIIGSGITGLNAALRIKAKQPGAKVLILEKGMLPEGASTKNAGFACFGSLSEILDDLNSHSEEEVLELIERRIKGLQLLRDNLGDKVIDFRCYGGYELFTLQDEKLYRECRERMPEINQYLKPVFKEDVFSIAENSFRYKAIQPKLIYNKFEGQIDTGKMMRALVKKAISADIRILNGIHVDTFSNQQNNIDVVTEQFTLTTKKLVIATNGFAARLGIEDVKPARAQVLITKPINDLKIQGTFHLDRGYYYFRNIGNRILLGGGRNLDFKTEETDKAGLTSVIQNKLLELLKNSILPNTDFEIQQSWSGIMGVGKQKKPMVKELENGVYCGVRLGGMGVAIGSLVGKELADLALTS